MTKEQVFTYMRPAPPKSPEGAQLEGLPTWYYSLFPGVHLQTLQ